MFLSVHTHCGIPIFALFLYTTFFITLDNDGNCLTLLKLRPPLPFMGLVWFCTVVQNHTMGITNQQKQCTAPIKMPDWDWLIKLWQFHSEQHADTFRGVESLCLKHSVLLISHSFSRFFTWWFCLHLSHLERGIKECSRMTMHILELWVKKRSTFVSER